MPCGVQWPHRKGSDNQNDDRRYNSHCQVQISIPAGQTHSSDFHQPKQLLLSRIYRFCAYVHGRWPDGGLSEGYGHDGPGVCLGDGQTEAYLKDMGMAGLASVWMMARRKPI